MLDKKAFYKSPVWYSYLILMIFFLSMLIWGLYECCFNEYWYSATSSYMNYDYLMSFLSVHVNIITIVWLIIKIFNYNKKPIGVNGTGFLLSLMNWNLIVFFIFWAAVISDLFYQGQSLTQYTKNQIACTIATHFICPLYLMILFVITTGKNKISYKKVFIEKDIYISIAYPFGYLLFIYVRGLMYLKDNRSVWPYPFMEFETGRLWIGNNVGVYMFILTIIFIIWIVAQHYLLVFINNLLYKLKNKLEERNFKLNK
ncbi:hypothetical protein [Spiroplasma turonicum]|uniref:Transmembrane protein n=1 Tax=Spiroplasma turonicum TaxID=216946 RepID=A0A0K1P6S2_9MOLU|nr:hypothetical protein [Spiroplasma turonicum]AKU80001.1 hypothetical protein STURON_00755 [Spiroplasma turonicum]ALX71003.1 hypothetical protein STURO_v1c07520 [Spiroplasma turonicum]